MGAYLSEPLTTKNSEDLSNDYLASGASSMQGWRVSQEDAHNCILNFDKNTSFFAVYDGHGGAEVAIYCSKYLPEFLKNLDSYKDRNFEKALKEAFIGFDSTLLEDQVIAELKRIADHNDKIMDRDGIDDDEDEDDEYDNVADLYKEATMPLNEVLEKYKDSKGDPNDPKNRIKAILANEKEPSKVLSPFLKGKRRPINSKYDDEAGGASSSSSSCAGPSSSSSSGINVGASSSSSSSAPTATSSSPSSLSKNQVDVEGDSTVSSSSSNKASKAAVDDGKDNQEPTSTNNVLDESIEKAEENQINEISDTAGNSNGGTSSKSNEEPEVPDSSSCKILEKKQSEIQKVAKIVNGNHQELDSTTTEKKETAEGVSSSSSVAQSENGEITSNNASSNVDSSSVVGKNGLAAIYESDDDDDDDSDDENYPQMDQGSSDDDDDDDEDMMAGGAEESDEEDEDEELEEEEDYLNAEDEEFMSNIVDEPGKDSGCTAVVALLYEKELYVANAGDSRCVVCRGGRALEMSFDHKPEDQIEYDRIKNAGGRVTLDGRVNGGLNLSRAIGDHGYKMNKSLPADQQMISALPDIKHITITPEDEFMVLACDGIWNFMTSEDVVEFVQERMKKNLEMSQICEEMFDYCLAPHTKGDGTGCDNMTAIIVQFRPNFALTFESVSRKRAASPTAESREAEQEPEQQPEAKKIKTMEDEAAVVVDTSE